MDATKKIEYQKLLMSLVPESGNNIGNVSLREQLQEKITVRETVYPTRTTGFCVIR
jgi:hypothetical protein